LALENFKFDQQLSGVCLSMPETPQRRDQFNLIRPKHFQLFDGVRNTTGWIGCASSYKFLCKAAIQANLPQLLICEDDVILPPDFELKLQIIQAHLSQQPNDWDIFAGLISNLHPETEVIDVQESQGLTFVTINKMTSTVFNIYNRSAMTLITRWDPNFKNAELNTIDRYIESQANLKIVTLLEPLFGHREEMKSTLWGFENTQYNDWIKASQVLLKQKVKLFLGQLKKNHPQSTRTTKSTPLNPLKIPTPNSDKFV
jgi:GR25 family glycosyltransferase involved in LPS biosynthesis